MGRQTANLAPPPGHVLFSSAEVVMNRLMRALGWAMVAGITLVHDGGDLSERIPQDLKIVDRQAHAYTCAADVVLTGSTCSTTVAITS